MLRRTTTVGIESWNDLDDERRARVLHVLANRYGDGTLYLCDPADREGHAIGRAIGLIDGDGVITPQGRSLVARDQGRS